MPFSLKITMYSLSFSETDFYETESLVIHFDDSLELDLEHFVDAAKKACQC